MEWGGSGKSSTWSSKNRTKVCGWMGYAVGDLRTSLGHEDVWIGVLVQCYTECNKPSVRVDRKRAWNREGQAGSGIWSSKNGIKG